MIRRGIVVRTGTTNPYRNIAREAYLLEKVPPETCIFYLWQNHRTVVIGRNQNAWAECRIEELERDGGFLARRLSGGGAVFHDAGNLNFTFLMPREDYDLERQSEVILRAVRNLGIDARRTGRNDIETDGRKFSGNAFYRAGKNAYHHGTLLVRTDLSAAGRYLSVSADKIQSKGVESVRSRMVNLGDCQPGLTIPALIKSLCAAFDEVYGMSAEIPAAEMPRESPPDLFEGSGERMKDLEARFSSPEWKYGKNPRFRFKAVRRFPWGGVELHFEVKENRIAAAHIFSDAMDSDFILDAAERLKGADFNPEVLTEKLTAAYPAGSEFRRYAGDIAAMVFEPVTPLCKETTHGTI
ncbi:MAG: lipoate--protein ligase [Spirochaetaceae bacterium]|jgi:lipoate-protein ligase A|nr:lipoate--protein ligase [Spirochaetaceae bacterium]